MTAEERATEFMDGVHLRWSNASIRPGYQGQLARQFEAHAREAVEAERKECAKVADKWWDSECPVAREIRDRGTE